MGKPKVTKREIYVDDVEGTKEVLATLLRERNRTTLATAVVDLIEATGVKATRGKPK